MFAEAEHQWNPRGLGGHSTGQRVGNPVGTVHEFPGQVLAKDIYTVIIKHIQLILTITLSSTFLTYHSNNVEPM